MQNNNFVASSLFFKCEQNCPAFIAKKRLDIASQFRTLSFVSDIIFLCLNTLLSF